MTTKNGFFLSQYFAKEISLYPEVLPDSTLELCTTNNFKATFFKKCFSSFAGCLIISRVRLFLEVTGITAQKSIDILQKVLNYAVHSLRKYDPISDFFFKFYMG